MKKLHFKTNVHLKNIIGRELINDDNVAIQELVKNSYDAGSKEVEIIFRNIKDNKDASIRTKSDGLENASKIFIIDSGEGMNQEDITNKWLNIAYSSKKSEALKFGRRMAGAKGVGRFSCDRLGEYLDIYTKSKGDKEINHLTICWNDFELESDINFEIQKVDIILNDPIPLNKFNKGTGFSIKSSGTILEISKLREKWIRKNGKKYDYDKLVSLKNSLEKLTNPNQQTDKNSFIIKLNVEDLDKKDFDLKIQKNAGVLELLKNKLVKNKIFNELSFRTTSINSEITPDGTQIITTLKDRDRIIFKLIEKNHFSELKNIKIVLYFLNQYSKAYFKRQTGIDSIKFGSIFIFINGFRIPPFGDFGSDWLGLELRKGQGRARFMGARELIGRVEVNDKENKFKIISNREGLVRNDAHGQLVGNSRDDLINSYFYAVFRKLELFVVEGLDWDRILKTKKSKTEDNMEEESPEITEILKDFYEKVNSDSWKYDPSIEKFAESQEEKDARVIQQIYRIITVTTNKDDIISLYINEEIILSLAKENVEKIESLLESVKNFDLTKFDLKTAKGIDKIKKTLAELSERAKKEEEKAADAEKRANEESKKRENAEKERDQAKEEAGREKGKREASEKREFFTKSLLGKDKEEIVNLQHQIKICSGNIESAMLNLKEIVERGEEVSKEKLMGIISKMIIESQKIKKITEIVTSANYDLKSKRINGNIVKFVNDYLDGFKTNLIETHTKNREIDFEMPFSPLEIQIIIDNIYDNAKKSGAKKMNVEIEKISNNELKLKFLDDGDRVEKNHIGELFKFGFTTKEGGSGLGLYNIRQILEGMKSEIIFVQNNNEKGFEVIFKK